MQNIDDLDVAGRRVLVRSDLNVPFDKSGNGVITDDGRIRASLPVIRKLAERGARVVVMAHLGRPKGEDFAERAEGGPSLLGSLMARQLLDELCLTIAPIMVGGKAPRPKTWRLNARDPAEH